MRLKAQSLYYQLSKVAVFHLLVAFTLSGCKTPLTNDQLIAGEELRGKKWVVHELYLDDQIAYRDGEVLIKEGDIVGSKALSEIDLLDIGGIAKEYYFTEKKVEQSEITEFESRMNTDPNGPAFEIFEFSSLAREFNWNLNSDRTFNIVETGMIFFSRPFEIFLPAYDFYLLRLNETEMHLLFECDLSEFAFSGPFDSERFPAMIVLKSA